jgi:hypothetical protein
MYKDREDENSDSDEDFLEVHEREETKDSGSDFTRF